MKHSILPLLLLTFAPLTATAQLTAHPAASASVTDEAQHLLDEHHFYGAATCDMPRQPLGEPEALMADYHLARPDTEERIAQWAEAHPVHPLTERLQLMRANLLVRQGRDREALRLYGSQPMENLPADEHCEARLYEAIAGIHTNQLERAAQLLESIEYEPTHSMDVQYYLGYVHYSQGHFREAQPYFQATSTSYDYRRTAPVYLADCQVQNGQCADAIRTLQAWRRQTGATALAAEADRVEGEALYGVRHYDEAIPLLQHYVQSVESPSRAALYKLGMSQLQVQNYGSAALHLSRSASTARDVMSQNAWLHAGIAYVQLGQKQQARMAFQQASEMNFDPSLEEEALYNYALTLYDGGDMGFGESVRVYEQFLQKFPTSKHAETINQHLIAAYVNNKNFDTALKAINRIQQPDENLRETKRMVLRELAARAFNNGKYSAVIDYMNQSIATGPTAQAYYLKGEAEYQQGKYDRAVASLKQALSASHNEEYRNDINYTLGYALFKQKKYGEALPYFQSTTSCDAHNRAGDCLFIARRYDEAYNSYQKAIDADQRRFDSNHTSQDYPRIQQAMIEGLRGNYSRKIELLSQVKGTDQNAAVAMFEKGKTYAQSGQKANAIDTFSSIQQQFPQSPYARRAANELALLYFESGRTEEAIRTYRSVIESSPNTPEAHTALDNLRDIFVREGRVQEYAKIAEQAGQVLSSQQLDQMTLDAAINATSAGRHQQAFKHYAQLENQSESHSMRLQALIGQIRSAAESKAYDDVIKSATRLLQKDNVSKEMRSEAQLRRGQAYMAQGDAKNAVDDLREASSDGRTVYGAQATVELAQYAYNTQQYQSAEQVLSPFIDSGTTHSYWLARAFILLSDVCAKTGRTVEARQYLLSLQSNYTESEEINQMIQQRLSQLQ